MPQRVLGGGEAGCRIGTEQGERGEGAFDGAAQAVVDDDPSKAVWIADDLLAGNGIAQSGRPTGCVRDNNSAVGAAEQPSIGQCLENGNGAWVTPRAERFDRLLLARETV